MSRNLRYRSAGLGVRSSGSVWMNANSTRYPTNNRGTAPSAFAQTARAWPVSRCPTATHTTIPSAAPIPCANTSDPAHVRVGRYSCANSTAAASSTHAGSIASPHTAARRTPGRSTHAQPSSANPSGTAIRTLAMPSERDSGSARFAIAHANDWVASPSGRARNANGTRLPYTMNATIPSDSSANVRRFGAGVTGVEFSSPSALVFTSPPTLRRGRGRRRGDAG